MYKLLALFAVTLSCIAAQAQPIGVKDTTVIRTSNVKNLSGFNPDPVSKVSMTAETFLNGRHGIEFTFTTKKKKVPPVIRLDSILLHAVTIKTLTLTHPYRDKIFAGRHRTRIYSVIMYLEPADWAFLKEEKIAEIGIIIDNKPLVLPLDKKSQRSLLQFAPPN